jgi:hypothetical protein
VRQNVRIAVKSELNPCTFSARSQRQVSYCRPQPPAMLSTVTPLFLVIFLHFHFLSSSLAFPLTLPVCLLACVTRTYQMKVSASSLKTISTCPRTQLVPVNRLIPMLRYASWKCKSCPPKQTHFSYRQSIHTGNWEHRKTLNTEDLVSSSSGYHSPCRRF